jgi:hypothetical protein
MVIGQGFRALPVEKRPRPGNAREPLAHLLDKLGWALRSGQFHPQTSFGSRVAGTDFDQQFGQSLQAEGFEVFRVRVVFAATHFTQAVSENDSLTSKVIVTRDASARQHAGEPSPVAGRGGNRNERARKPVLSETEAEIAGLLDRSTPELRLAWCEFYRAGPPLGLSRDLLIRALANQLQERSYAA